MNTVWVRLYSGSRKYLQADALRGWEKQTDSINNCLIIINNCFTFFHLIDICLLRLILFYVSSNILKYYITFTYILLLFYYIYVNINTFYIYIKFYLYIYIYICTWILLFLIGPVPSDYLLFHWFLKKPLFSYFCKYLNVLFAFSSSFFIIRAYYYSMLSVFSLIDRLWGSLVLF